MGSDWTDQTHFDVGSLFAFDQHMLMVRALKRFPLVGTFELMRALMLGAQASPPARCDKVDSNVTRQAGTPALPQWLSLFIMCTQTNACSECG